MLNKFKSDIFLFQICYDKNNFHENEYAKFPLNVFGHVDNFMFMGTVDDLKNK